ncbi:MAG: SIS domain-containing protein [Planctomycetaceae bacterium]|nr:SIS domain-containing protein [Planctomycetaceae bacterium]
MTLNSNEPLIRQRFEEAASLTRLAQEQLAPRIAAAADAIVAAYRNGGGVFLFGNGGSAADAQHMAGELVGRFLKNRRALKAEALTVNSSVLTALANDFGYQSVFARQLEANAKSGDVAVALSTSGNAPSVIAAMKQAKAMGLTTIALTGRGGGQCAALADILLDIPSDQTPRIQEVSTIVYHVLCELVEAQAGAADLPGVR